MRFQNTRDSVVLKGWKFQLSSQLLRYKSHHFASFRTARQCQLTALKIRYGGSQSYSVSIFHFYNKTTLYTHGIFSLLLSSNKEEGIKNQAGFYKDLRELELNPN